MEQKGEKEKNAAASFEKIQEALVSSTSSASAGPSVVEGPVDENGVPPLLHDRVHVAPPTPPLEAADDNAVSPLTHDELRRLRSKCNGECRGGAW